MATSATPALPVAADKAPEAPEHQRLISPRLSANSDKASGSERPGLIVPTGRVAKSSYSTRAKRTMEVRGYNASVEFLSKFFDIVGLVAYKGPESERGGARSLKNLSRRRTSDGDYSVDSMPGPLDDVEHAMESLPTAFARHLSTNTGSALTLQPDKWRSAVYKSLQDAVKDACLFQSNGSTFLCWSVVVVCRLGGDGARKPSWLITSCSQGNGCVTLIAPPAPTGIPGVAVSLRADKAKGASEEEATCIRFNGNSVLQPEGSSPNMGQFMGAADQGCRVFLQATANGTTYDTSSNSPVEQMRLTTLWETRNDPVHVSLRAVMRQLVHMKTDDTSMIVLELLPFTKLAYAAQALNAPDQVQDTLDIIQSMLCCFQTQDEADGLKDIRGKHMRTGAVASPVFVSSDYE